mgnify:FL=1
MEDNNWKHIRDGVPEYSETLRQYLVFSRGLYSVCTIEFDEGENRRYFRDDNCMEVVPEYYKLLPDLPEITPAS